MVRFCALFVLVTLAASAAAVHASPSNTRTKVSWQASAEALRAPVPNTNWTIVSVLDFGAVGNGVADNTAAFQRALNSMSGGGVVWVPTGQYVFRGSLNVPTAVTLQGTYGAVPSHNVGQGGLAPTDGSVFLVRGGRGNSSATPFLTLNTDSTLRGVVIYYPDQSASAVPAPYPYTIDMTGNNPAVVDVELLNPFNGIRAVGAARHFISRVQGQPANIGIYVDETYDIGRIENVHWNPWFSPSKTYMSWQLVNGRAFVFARTDWEYVLNCFAFGYAIGYHFIASSTGSCNGNFLGIGADMAANASVQVDAADPWGIMITNGEFTSFVDPNFGPTLADPTQVYVSASNAGAVRFVNSAFWGPSHQIAQLDGSGTVGFSSCTFSQWDAAGQGRPAIAVTDGNLVVQGCEFQYDGTQVYLESANKAVIMGNIMKGAERIIKNTCNNLQVGLNAADS